MILSTKLHAVNQLRTKLLVRDTAYFNFWLQDGEFGTMDIYGLIIKFKLDPKRNKKTGGYRRIIEDVYYKKDK